MRKHSKFSASGAERWFNCSGSVALSEGQPDKDSVWAREGTLAHEVLEDLLKRGNRNGRTLLKNIPKEMERYGSDAADFILNLHEETFHSEILVETRIHLDFIHPDMFGTFDGAVIDYFGTLHVFDYKYGAGHSVSPVENLQMIFYGLGLANKYNWNFSKVRLWIIQPRIRGYDGPTFWEISILELISYIKEFRLAVNRVGRFPNLYQEGEWCWFCKAKNICPLKNSTRQNKLSEIFKSKPIN